MDVKEVDELDLNFVKLGKELLGSARAHALEKFIIYPDFNQLIKFSNGIKYEVKGVIIFYCEDYNDEYYVTADQKVVVYVRWWNDINYETAFPKIFNVGMEFEELQSLVETVVSYVNSPATAPGKSSKESKDGRNVQRNPKQG